LVSTTTTMAKAEDGNDEPSISAAASSGSPSSDTVVGKALDWMHQLPSMFIAYSVHLCRQNMKIISFHSIRNVVDCGVLQEMWVELVGKVGRRDQLIIC